MNTGHTAEKVAGSSSIQERWNPCPIHASQNQPCRECRLSRRVVSCCLNVGTDACNCERPFIAHPIQRVVPPGVDQNGTQA